MDTVTRRPFKHAAKPGNCRKRFIAAQDRELRGFDTGTHRLVGKLRGEFPDGWNAPVNVYIVTQAERNYVFQRNTPIVFLFVVIQSTYSRSLYLLCSISHPVNAIRIAAGCSFPDS